MYICALKFELNIKVGTGGIPFDFESINLKYDTNRKTMKKGIHPENYRLVAFKDMSNDDVFITKSTVETKETITHEGVEYPVFKMEISRTSHPFYTGKSKLIDTAGRIDKFNSKYAKKAK